MCVGVCESMTYIPLSKTFHLLSPVRVGVGVHDKTETGREVEGVRERERERERGGKERGEDNIG